MRASVAAVVFRRSLPVLLCLWLVACKTTSNANSEAQGLGQGASATDPDYRQAVNLPLNAEYIPAEEPAFMANLSARVYALHAEQPKGKAQAAPKAQSCVRGSLHVVTAQPQYARAIFASQKDYPVVARFVSGSSLPQPATTGEVRGFAIKVLGVGPPYLSQASTPGVQDLLLADTPKHHASDIVELVQHLEASAEGGIPYAAFLASHPVLAATLKEQSSRLLGSFLAASYWSRSAYTLGPALTVKFVVQPCNPGASLNSTNEDPESLAKDLASHLAAAPACFQLYAQPQLNPRTEPIENHQVAWQTPKVLLAQLSFPVQTPDRSAGCEALVFNPWNGHQDMRPLGNMNRSPLAIY